LQSLRELNCEIAVSILFGYILRPEFIALPSAGCINLHPSLLPYNRGAHPNVWSIIDGTPAGTTLHYIDPGVDTGDIIAQREIAVLPIDTGETLYRRLEQVSLDLFKETWPAVRMGNPPRVPQGSHPGTSHHSSDLQRIDAIDLDATYKARDLINLMRARTFSPYPGAHFQCGGRRIYISLQLAFGDESRS
jgi:methionyl-tRNA formyltransferase